MVSTMVWAAVVLVVTGAIIWRADRLLNRRFSLGAGEAEVALRERRTAAKIAEMTVEQAAELKRAQLERQIVEARWDGEMIEQLQGDRLAAERAILAARVKAEQQLAVENVRADHEVRRVNYVGEYARYLESLKGRAYMHFDDFVRAIKDAQ